jgi:hypothetical protein
MKQPNWVFVEKESVGFSLVQRCQAEFPYLRLVFIRIRFNHLCGLLSSIAMEGLGIHISLLYCICIILHANIKKSKMD